MPANAGIQSVTHDPTPASAAAQCPSGLVWAEQWDCDTRCVSVSERNLNRKNRGLTPAGTVATVVHWGAYDKLGGAYDALRKWSKETGRVFAGPFWEVYGHWSDDPAQVRTDIFQLLA